MIRVRILVEGMSELRYVEGVLAAHFANRLLLEPFTPRTGKNPWGGVAKGGATSWSSINHSLRQAILAEGHKQDVWFSTMLDLYALPSGSPGVARDGATGALRATAIERAIADAFDHPRFIPHLQVHEFEALLFSDMDVFSDDYGSSAVEALRRNVGGACPEEINSTLEGHPCRRLERHLPGYFAGKATRGPIYAERIGLNRIRAACSHHDAWVSRLEALA